MLSDINQFWIFVPDIIYILSKFLNDAFKIFLTVDVTGNKTFDRHNDFINKIVFIFVLEFKMVDFKYFILLGLMWHYGYIVANCHMT